MIVLPNYDIAGITTPEQGLGLIAENLVSLRVIAEATDFSKADERERFCQNLGFLKQYYEHTERLCMQREGTPA